MFCRRLETASYSRITMYVVSPFLSVICLNFLVYASSSSLFCFALYFVQAFESSAPAFILRKSLMKYHVPAPGNALWLRDFFSFDATLAKFFAAIAFAFAVPPPDALPLIKYHVPAPG